MTNASLSYAGLCIRITVFALDCLLIAGYLLLAIVLSSAVNTLWSSLAQ